MFKLTRKNNLVELFIVFIGVGLIVFIPALLLGISLFDLESSPDSFKNSLCMNVFGVFLAILTLRRFEKFPNKNPVAYIIPIVITIFSLIIILMWIMRLDYSVKTLVAGFGLTLVIMSLTHTLARKARKYLYFGLDSRVLVFESNYVKFEFLAKTEFPLPSSDGIVVDLHSFLMTDEDDTFLADCALQNVPVFDLSRVEETLTGRVNIRHLVENDFGSLNPSPAVVNLKRAIDLVFVLLSLPIVLPVSIIISLCIVLETKGGALFVQDRVGLGGEIFKLYKFRSMLSNHLGEDFTEKNGDQRITIVGNFIRKYRLDEIPQFWNVLIGDMSLIGPRPESIKLAEMYKAKVPFFMYRHVVRPGISGWAQVMQGYAAGIDEVKEKLSYDFYYIKNFSLWLDLLIWYKTIRTVLTGFGSR